MDSVTQELIEGLKKALQAERTGGEFYKMAARTTEDPQGRAVFERLAREEQEHFDFLAAHYRALVEEGRLADVKLEHGDELSASTPIFSDALRARIGQAHFEMSALAIAAQLELNAITHYRAQAEKARDPKVRKFWQELATWETAHYDAFMRQQQALQEEYWAQAAFSPF